MSKRRGLWAGWGATVVAALLASTAPLAAPYLPSDDAQVLERLPRTTASSRELKALKAAAAQGSADVASATALARRYIELARAEGDPRFLGYAQAALAPWWQSPDAPTPVLVLRATILQSSHRFDAALADLALVRQREPRNAQALLTIATVLTVQGKYADARAACERFAGAVPEIYRVICVASVDGVTGRAEAAYGALRRALATLPRIDGAARLWGETLLGEIAHRRGDAAAQAHFETALAMGERDLYLLGAYADWLLDQGRYAEVVTLLAREQRVDPLLLRLAIAYKASGDPRSGASIATLRERFAASEARGDNVHQREHARFALALDGDAPTALRLALADWQVQREPADLRIVAEAAAAANDAAALTLVRQWLASTGLEYRAIAELAGAGRGQRGKP